MSQCTKDDPNAIKPGTEDASIAKSVLGRGYDISDRFAHTESIKEAVLDFDKLVRDDRMIKDPNIASTEVRTLEGETIQAYQFSFSYAQTWSVGVPGLFSGEAGVNFGYERASSAGYSFATVSSFTYKYGMYIDGRTTPEALSEYVSPQFLSDAQSMDPEELIESYGTHVVVGGKWGASFDYSMSAKRITSSSAYSFGAFVKADATIKGINLGGSTDINTQFSNYYETASKSVYAKAKGGDSEYILAIAAASTGEGLDDAYMRWIETIDQNPVFCDYYKKGLVPIYEFISDQTLRDKLKDGIDAYMIEKNIESVEPVEKIISGLFHKVDFCQVISGDGEVKANGNGDIRVYLSFSIGEIPNSNNLKLAIEMEVHEQKGDYTKIEGKTEAKIVNNDPINSIELSNPSYSFDMQEKFKSTQYFSPLPWIQDNLPPDWLKDIEIRIDGTGANDKKYIGVKGKVEIPVTVYKL